MLLKRCFKCGQEKQIDDFYRHPRMADGHLGKCKECTKADVRRRYYSKHDEMMAYEHKRIDDPGRRTRMRLRGRARYRARSHEISAASRASRLRYPDHKKANTLVGNAIRDGRLVRQPCEVCGAEPTHAHHDDYSKPLEVRWLCTYHHGVAHRDSKYRKQEVAA